MAAAAAAGTHCDVIADGVVGRDGGGGGLRDVKKFIKTRVDSDWLSDICYGRLHVEPT